jgi:hypothetical protein
VGVLADAEYVHPVSALQKLFVSSALWTLREVIFVSHLPPHKYLSPISFHSLIIHRLLLTTIFGVLAGFVKILDATVFVSQSTTFVFYVALPSLILNSIGIQTDFYSEKFLWDFIVAFLLLRVVALVVAIVVVALDHRRHGMGQIAVLWLAMSWISTVILGVPIASAVFDDPTKGTSWLSCEHSLVYVGMMK